MTEQALMTASTHCGTDTTASMPPWSGIGAALWSLDLNTDTLVINERASALLGGRRQAPWTLDALVQHFDIEDQTKAQQAFGALRGSAGSCDIDVRLRRDDEAVWINVRDLGTATPSGANLIYGIFLDVTRRKLADEARDLEADEMRHWVKNFVAVAAGLTSLSARYATTAAGLADDLIQRLSAVAAGHELVRKSAACGKRGLALLGDLFATLLGPYDKGGVVGDRIHASLPEIRIGEKSATILGLIIHELATNSVKYGCLSVVEGCLSITGVEQDGHLVIVWCERCGPAIRPPKGPDGFGSKLIRQSIAHRFGGTMACDWQAEGAVITFRIGAGRLAA